MLVTFPFHHVVLRLAEKSVLRAKKCCEAEKITVVSLENSRRVLKFCRDGCGMKQRPHARAAKFLRPEFSQVIERKQDGHNGLLAQRKNSRDFVMAAAVSAATFKRSLRRTPLQQSAQRDSNDYRDRRHSCA